jgi:hypothetical protein
MQIRHGRGVVGDTYEVQTGGVEGKLAGFRMIRHLPDVAPDQRRAPVEPGRPSGSVGARPACRAHLGKVIGGVVGDATRRGQRTSRCSRRDNGSRPGRRPDPYLLCRRSRSWRRAPTRRRGNPPTGTAQGAVAPHRPFATGPPRVRALRGPEPPLAPTSRPRGCSDRNPARFPHLASEANSTRGRLARATSNPTIQERHGKP